MGRVFYYMGKEIEISEALIERAHRELAALDFRYFIQQARPDYQFNWHHDRLIDALQRLADREYKRLIVMMPPRHGKSELVSRLFPAWILGRNGNEQIILSSYSLDLASAMNRDCQRIIQTPAFSEMFPGTRLSDGTGEAIKTQKRFDIVGKKGYYVSAGVGGGITGVGATVAIVDDPVKNAAEADSTTYRDAAWEWYTTTFRTRFEPDCIEVICQTRWHEDDLTGRILQRTAIGADTQIVNFPAICEQAEESRNAGEPLWESKYSLEKLNEIRQEVGSRAWNALYQQRPAPDEGSILKKAWFRTYRAADLPDSPVNFYFDTAYTDKEANDPTAGIAYIKRGPDFYILACVEKWLDFTGQIAWIQAFANANGYTPRSLIRIEPKATGKSVVEVIRKQTGLNVKEADAPKDSKTARANAVSPIVEAGRVFVPEGVPWVDAFFAQIAAFPNAAHDDMVDCLVGMIQSEQTTGVRVHSTAR